MLIRTSLFVAAALCAANAAVAQTPASQPATGAQTAPAKDEGIPVQSDLVRSRCGGCHRSDDQKRMSRISYRRTTPEGWEQTIKRMVTLNHATLEPAEARAIVQYLADHHGLAPEEARPAAFEVERRTIDFTYTADKDTADTCSSCHSMAACLAAPHQRRVGAARRDASRLLPARRLPGVPAAGFRRTRPTDRARPRRPAARQPPSDGQGARAPDDGVSADDAGVVGVVGDDAQPRDSTGRGRCRLRAGQGAVYGEVTITRRCRVAPTSSRPRRRITIARSGRTRDAQRARARLHRLPVARPVDGRRRRQTSLREVMFVDRDWQPHVRPLVHRRLRRDRPRRAP